MKKILPLIALLSLLLCGCTAPPVAPETPDPPVQGDPAPIPPLHTPLYIEGFDVEEILLYFNEVCLDAEVINSGDPSRLQKWVSPIRYRLSGSYDDEDAALLRSFADWLNTVEGFPGMTEAGPNDEVNLQINFCSADDFSSFLGDWAIGMDGAVTFWYNGYDEITSAVICYREDMERELRNSVILEEVYNGLGPVQDTTRRTDSIIYAEFSQPQNLSSIDELLLRLLYHPDMQCGMDAAQCEAVIRQLYY